MVSLLADGCTYRNLSYPQAQIGKEVRHLFCREGKNRPPLWAGQGGVHTPPCCATGVLGRGGIGLRGGSPQLPAARPVPRVQEVRRVLQGLLTATPADWQLVVEDITDPPGSPTPAQPPCRLEWKEKE